MKTQRETELESGIVVVESVDDVETTKQSISCGICKRQSTQDGVFIWKTSDGFEHHHPTCGHGVFYLCQDCKWTGCPTCGSGEEYT